MALQSYKDALHRGPKQRRCLLLTNCRIIDVEAGQELGGKGALHQVLVNPEGTIASVSAMAAGLPSQLPAECVTVDCEGLWLLPGRSMYMCVRRRCTC
jgi:imidazolonepropionase-like amidohydrolase